jgi:hypothetical protein
MINQLPPKPLIGWLGEDVPSWGNFIMNRVNDREPFATKAGYGRLLSLLHCIDQDTAAFKNLEEARAILPPLMSDNLFPIIRAEAKLFNLGAAAYNSPPGEFQAFEAYSVVGWLMVVQRMLYNIKTVYNMHYWVKLGEFGYDTWCAYTAEDFAHAMWNALDIYYDGGLTPEQETLLDVGRAAAVERIYTLSDQMI